MMNGKGSELGKLFNDIEKKRNAVELEGATLRVTHGGTCQKDMQHVGSGLSDGATRIFADFVCPEHHDVCVTVRLTAPPDTPFQIYEKLGVKK